MTMEIKCTRGLVAIVDDEDYEFLAQRSWCASKAKNRHGGFYAMNRSLPGSYMHRIIMQAGEGQQVDHINHDTLDNRRRNLRICSAAENSWNRPNMKPNMTGYRGVNFRKARGKYVGVVRKGGRARYTKQCETALEAAVERDILAIKLHGRYAVLNFPDLSVGLPTSEQESAAA